MCAVTVVAKDQGLEDDLVRLKEDQCVGYKEQELLEVLSECREVLNESPRETKVVQMRIDLEEGTQVRSQKPYRVPDRLREGVKREIDTLLESRVREPSECMVFALRTCHQT